jgi:hypothetical protein
MYNGRALAPSSERTKSKISTATLMEGLMDTVFLVQSKYDKLGISQDERKRRRIERGYCEACDNYGCFTCTEYMLTGHCPSAHNEELCETQRSLIDSNSCIEFDHRKDLEPGMMQVSTIAGFTPELSKNEPAGLQRAEALRGKSFHLKDFYYKYDENTRYYVKHFKNFSVIYKYEWNDLGEHLRKANLSKNQFKKIYPGRISRDFGYSIKQSIHYSIDRPDPLQYGFKKLHRKLPSSYEPEKGMTLFNFLMESGISSPLGIAKKRDFSKTSLPKTRASSHVAKTAASRLVNIDNMFFAELYVQHIISEITRTNDSLDEFMF